MEGADGGCPPTSEAAASSWAAIAAAFGADEERRCERAGREGGDRRIVDGAERDIGDTSDKIWA